MRRSPLRRRGAPLKRSTRLKQRRSTPRKSSRVHDRAYMARVRELPCCALKVAVTIGADIPLGDLSAFCNGGREAHHMGGRGLGQKCSDLETVPFCAEHHRQWHDCAGLFAGWPKSRRGAYAQASIAQTRAALGVP